MTADSFEGMRPTKGQPQRGTRSANRGALWTGAVAVSAMAAIAAGSFAFLCGTHAGADTGAGAAPVRLASLGGYTGMPSPEDDGASGIVAGISDTRSARTSADVSGNGFLSAAPAAAGHELAERGGRVFHPDVTASDEAPPAGKAPTLRAAATPETTTRPMAAAKLPDHGVDADLVVASLTTKRPELARDIIRSIPKHLEAEVAAEAPRRDAPAAAARPQSPGALARLAAFAPQPSLRPGLSGTAVAAYQSPGDIPRPSFRPEVDAAIGTEIAVEAGEPADASVLSSVPLPAARPETAAGEEVQVASLEPEGLPGPLGTVTEEMTALVVPLPERRPNYQPPVAAKPQPEPAQQQPAQRRAPQQAPAVASTRPSEPGQDADRGIGGFFQKLFKGGSSAKLPEPGRGIAVYDITAQTVYLPGDGKLEAHSGLGHMQDDPRYVHMKNRGPTPPNVYNLRMREALFHGAEAIRLLPADGRKKFNRDGLLAHPYMYIGGGDRSQSNGCIVFKNYDRFLAAFKRGKIKKMIVVKSLDELPTYMAAL